MSSKTLKIFTGFEKNNVKILLAFLEECIYNSNVRLGILPFKDLLASFCCEFVFIAKNGEHSV